MAFSFYDNLLLKLGCLQPPSHTGTRQKLFWLFYNWLFGSANLYLTCNKKNPVMKAGLDKLLEFNLYDYLLLKLGCLQPLSHTGSRQKLFWSFYKWLFGSTNLYLSYNFKNPVIYAGLDLLLEFNFCDNLLLKEGCFRPPSHTGSWQKLFWLIYKWLCSSANLYLTIN